MGVSLTLSDLVRFNTFLNWRSAPYVSVAQCVKLVKLLRPKFVTVEEVPHFLVKRFSSQASDGKKSVATVCLFALPVTLPLLMYETSWMLCIHTPFESVSSTERRMPHNLLSHSNSNVHGEHHWWLRIRRCHPCRQQQCMHGSLCVLSQPRIPCLDTSLVSASLHRHCQLCKTLMHKSKAHCRCYIGCYLVDPSRA